MTATTPRNTRLHRLEKSATARFARPPCIAGMVLTTLFFICSLSPSLVPRGAISQGVLSGFCMAVGYALGGAVQWLWRYLQLPPVLRHARLEALDEWGGWLGYGHLWNAHWRSTVTWGRLYLQRSPWLAPDAFRRSDYLAANVVYSPTPSWSWGLEVLYGRLEQQYGEAGDVVRVQNALKYDFIK